MWKKRKKKGWQEGKKDFKPIISWNKRVISDLIVSFAHVHIDNW